MPNHSLLSVVSREMEIYVCTKFKATLLTTAQKCKQPQSLSNDDLIKILMWYMYTMKYYLISKRNEVHATQWMNLENVTKVKESDTKATFL
jgi:hypothetical protein